MKNFHITGLVLAAGSSSRLGRPKQLVQFKGTSLVARVVDQLNDAGCSSVTTVLGANHKQIASNLKSSKTQIVLNENWKLGIGSSIGTGLKRVTNETEFVLIALCDQPLVETQHYKQLIDAALSGISSIVATEYDPSVTGVPAVFSKCHFDLLGNLCGDSGAKKIIAAYDHHTLPIIGKTFDLDDNEDASWLRSIE